MSAAEAAMSNAEAVMSQVSPLAAAPVMGGLVTDALETRLRELGPFDAAACMSCGFCTASCPLGIDALPRRVFRYVVFGLADQVRAQSEAVFSCLLCRACEQSCPAGVHITENVRLLRGWLLGEGR